MKDFLYLQYIIIRPLGITPNYKDFDRKAELVLNMIIDDERKANILANKKVCKDCYGRMMSFIIRVQYSSDGWYLPQNLSIKGNKLFQAFMLEDEWYNKELSTNINNIYCLED